jgi:hypothetical protein
LDDDCDTTDESDGKYDPDRQAYLDMHMDHDVVAPYGIDLDGNVDNERDGDNTVEQGKEEKDKEEEKEENEEEDEEEEDEDGDQGKEP